MIPKRHSPAASLRSFLEAQGATEALKDLDALLAHFAAPPKPSPLREMESWVVTAYQLASAVACNSLNDRNKVQANWLAVRGRRAVEFAKQWVDSEGGKRE